MTAWYESGVDILDILHESMLEGDDKEVFFLDEYPEVEGWVCHLKNKGFIVTFQTQGNISAWVISWSQELALEVLGEYKMKTEWSFKKETA